MKGHTESQNNSIISRSHFIKSSGITFAGLMMSPLLSKSGELFSGILQTKRSGESRDFLQEVHPGRIGGYVGKRLQDSYEHHILMQDVDHLVDPFHYRTETRFWQSEFWGKWFTSAVLANYFNPGRELKEKLQYAVESLLKTQTEDGYIGNYAETHRLQQWDIWGRKYTMLGLLANYQQAQDVQSLEAAKRVADHLIHELEQQGGVITTKGNYRGMAASSVLEPICLLYNFTKQEKYLDFAETIVRQWEEHQGPGLIAKAEVDVAKRFPRPETSWYSWEQGQKAYEMMSCYEGLLELYRITGKEPYKKAVERVWDNIRDTEMNIAGSGASAEMWFGGKQRQVKPVYHYQETCVTVTWIKLSHQLFRLTGEAKYADAVEVAFYNALLGSFNHINHKWAKYTPLIGQRLPGSGQCGMHLNCCEASGPRGMFNIPSHIVMRKKDGIAINYYIDGDYKVDDGDQPIRILQNTTYPESGTIKISLGLKNPKSFSLSLRIPAWSARHSVQINGENIPIEKTGYLVLNRTWRDEDSIVITLDMRGRVERVDGHVAIMRGPVVLARDSRLEGPHLTNTVTPIVGDNGYLELLPVSPAKKDVWMAFSAAFMPESYTEEPAQPIPLQLCDYASAGYGAGEVVYKVWMPELQDPRT